MGSPQSSQQTGAAPYSKIPDCVTRPHRSNTFAKDLLLRGVRWYRVYPLSSRNLEDKIAARGVEVDHSNRYRWVQTFTPQREAAFRTGKKRPVGTSWRMDEPSIPRKGQWNYRYRAVDKAGQTLDFLLTAPRDKKAALRFLKQAVRQHGMPVKSTIDKRGAHTAAIAALKEATSQESEIRPINYLNTLVEQDPRAGKRIRRPRLGFKAFDSAGRTLCGIELRRLIKQGQRIAGGREKLSAARPFY